MSKACLRELRSLPPYQWEATERSVLHPANSAMMNMPSEGYQGLTRHTRQLRNRSKQATNLAPPPKPCKARCVRTKGQENEEPATSCDAPPIAPRFPDTPLCDSQVPEIDAAHAHGLRNHGNSKVSHLEAAAQQSASPEAARSLRGEYDASLAQDLAIVHAEDPTVVHAQCNLAPKPNGVPVASLTPDPQLAGACKAAVRADAQCSPTHIITPELVSAAPPSAATPHRARAGVGTQAAPEDAAPWLNGSDDGTTSFERHQGCVAGTDAPPSPPSAYDAPVSLGRLSDTGSDGACSDKSRSPKFGLAQTKPAAPVPAATEVGNAAPPPVSDARSSLRAADAMSLTSPMQTGTAPRLAPAEPPSTQHQTLSVAVVSSDVPVAQTAAEAQSVAERGAALALSLMATAPPADDAQTKPRPTYGPQHVAATDSNPFMPLPCAQRSWARHKAVATPVTCPPPTPRSAADDARSVGRSSRCAAVAALGVAASSVTQPRPHRKRSRSSSSGGGAARPEAAARTAERSQKALCCVRGAPVCAPALQASWHAAPVLTRPDPRLPLFKPAPAVALFCGQVPRSLPCTAAHVTSSALLAAVWRASR